jgi:hypothetical protein
MKKQEQISSARALELAQNARVIVPLVEVFPIMNPNLKDDNGNTALMLGKAYAKDLVPRLRDSQAAAEIASKHNVSTPHQENSESLSSSSSWSEKESVRKTNSPKIHR